MTTWISDAAEQIGHLEEVRTRLEAIRDRAVSDAQRATQDAAYAGATYRDLGLELRATREVIDDLFADLIGPVERCLAKLNSRLGRAA